VNVKLRHVLRACWTPLATRAARHYVAGPDLADALRTCRQLSRLGFAGTVGYWNGDSESPRQLADTHLAILDALAREGLNCSISVKAPPLGWAPELLMAIVERARRTDVGIHFDSLAPDASDATFAIIAEALPRYPRLGCTLPGRWRRSVHDADRAVELGVTVRVVKGQWADSAGPDLDMRTGFLAVIDRLAGRAAQVGVATHDVALAREALRRLRAANTPCELELLLGLPTELPLRTAAAAGAPVRFYVPYGQSALPYRLSQVPQNPRVAWWIVRDLLAGPALPRSQGAQVAGGQPGA
jgi:proline dehydrogenase